MAPGAVARRPELRDGHLVAGERAGLVGVDDRRRAEGLDRGQAAHDGAPARHAPDADGQGDRDDRRQALGDRGDRQRDGGEHGVCHGKAAKQAQREEEHGHDDDCSRQPPAEDRDLARQRRLGLRGLPEQRGDPPELGAVAGGDDDGRPDAVGGERAAVDHAGPVAEFRSVLDRLGPLLRGHGFPGQGRLVDLESLGGEDPGVGRHLVPRREEHHVAGDQIVGRDLDAPAVAERGRPPGDEAREGLYLLAGPVLLDEPDDGVEDNDREHHQGVHGLPEDERQRRGGQEHPDQRGIHLAPEDRPDPLAGDAVEHVRPELLKPPLHLRALQPSLDRGPEVPDDLFGGTGGCVGGRQRVHRRGPGLPSELPSG